MGEQSELIMAYIQGDEGGLGRRPSLRGLAREA